MADTPQIPVTPQTPSNMDEGEFFNKYKPSVTEDDFFNKYNPTVSKNPLMPVGSIQDHFFNNGPYHGPASDYWFTNSSLGRILSAFGEGAKDSWGANGGSVYQDELKWEAEHKDKDHDLVYGLHTSWMRPLSASIDALVKAPFAFGGSFAEGIGQTGQELSDVSKEHPILGAPAGAAGELLKEAASGAIPEGLPHVPDHIQQIQSARAAGIIGEGEAGFYKTVKPTEGNLEARRQAVINSGETYGPETARQWAEEGKVLPTERDLARQIDPDTFAELDKLQDLKENLHNSIVQEVTKTRQALEQGVSERHPEMIDRQESIKDMGQRVQEADEKIRDLIPDVASATNRSQELLESQSTEGDAFRNMIQAQALEKAIRLEELKPKIRKAYRDAAELIPVAEEAQKNAITTDQNKSSPLSTKTTSAPQQILQTEGLGARIKEGAKSKGTKETGTANKLEIEAVQKGFVDYFPDKSLYDPTSYNEQGERAVNFVKSKYEEGKKIISGESESPPDIHGVAIFNAMKQEAFKKGDIETIQELSRSPYNRKISEAGQTLGLTKGMFDTFDPVSIIKNIQDAWETKGKSKLEKTMDEIKKFQDAAIEKFKPDVEAFLKSIECDY